MSGFQIKAFDVIFGVILAAGFFVGRRRGMSGELLGLLQWASVVFGGAAIYNPAASYLVSMGAGQFSLGFCQVAAYFVWGFLMWIVFHSLRNATGDKILQSDLFGRAEYYLGMVAGMVRFSIITLFFLALLNAKNVTQAELAEERRKQLDLYGSSFFPTIGQIQQGVFQESFVGRFIKAKFDPQLLHISTAPAAGLKGPSTTKSNLDEILNAK